MHCPWRLLRDLAPLRGTLGQGNDVAQLQSFQCRSGNGGARNQLPVIFETVKLKSAADAQELADFDRQLLLFLKPAAVPGRRKRRHPRGAEWRPRERAQ